MQDKETIILFSAGGIFFFILITLSTLLIPENCHIFETRDFSLLCDTIDSRNPPQPCPICENKSAATIARIFFGLGIAFLLLPGVVYFLRHRRIEYPKTETGDLSVTEPPA